MKNTKTVIIVLLILTITFTIIGVTFAYFTWQTSESQKTEVTFNINQEFSCSADIGGVISSDDTSLMPDTCTGSHAIRRTLTTNIQNTNNLSVYMDLWLDIKELGTGLSNSNNFKYSLTTSSTSCNTGVVSSGTFTGKTQGNKISLLSAKDYTSTTTDTYYLYIWLDKAETSPTTQNQRISLSLNGSCDEINAESISKPELDDGMIPVIFDTSGSDTIVKTISKDDPSWYNYRKKEWANVVLTTNDSRSKYLGTSGVSVSESDILAYYVWIPRYKYKIWTTTTSSTSQEQTIDIVFENNDTPKSAGTTVGSYRTHSAFTFGNTELNGIWAGKFETTGNATTPTIKPNITSLRSQNVSTQFATAQKFGTSTYGSTSKVDAHMMKNSEWGAVAYLSHSKYGINEEIYINNSSGFYTGRSAGTVGLSSTQSSSTGTYTWDGKGTSSGSYASDRTLGTKASTTGNITGIYDMSGGAYDRVMGNYNSEINGAGFSAMPESKYYDKYIINSNSLCTIESCGGHALFETASWYGDSAYFVISGSSWFVRGGSCYYGVNGGSFYSSNDYGDAYSGNTFRSVIVYIK